MKYLSTAFNSENIIGMTFIGSIMNTQYVIDLITDGTKIVSITAKEKKYIYDFVFNTL